MRWLFPSIIMTIVLMSRGVAAQDWRDQVIAALGEGGVYVEEANGRPLLTYRVDDPFVPASTIKIATAAAALYYLGKEFRFPTDFFLTSDKRLIVKGYGDPALLSEELERVAIRLRQRGVQRVTGIVLDATYFAPDIVIDGVERSSNPYDALNSALLANFNTIHVRKYRNGRVESAEPQTPITPIAAQYVRRLPTGTHRINLASDPAKALRYVGELLAACLMREGVTVDGEIVAAAVPADARLVYRHLSSQQLTEVLRGMLEFSTNLTANQLFLAMGAMQLGGPATVEKGVRVMQVFLREQVGWKSVQIAEGSGLSRATRVTPRQMMQLLRYFVPFRELLPLKDGVFQAKTGTLIGVNTYTGFFPTSRGPLARFVILVNDQVPFAHKFKLARMVYTGVTGRPPPITDRP